MQCIVAKQCQESGARALVLWSSCKLQLPVLPTPYPGGAPCHVAESCYTYAITK